MSLIHRARNAYETLPEPIHGVAGAAARALPVKMRYGAAYCEEMALLERAEASPEAERALVVERFHAVVEAALRTPYWARGLGLLGVEDAADLTLAELGRLPLLEKAIVRESLEEMIDPARPSRERKYVTTGGTTGRPLGIWIDKDASPRDWAHVVRTWGALGFQLDEKRVVLRGVRLGSGEQRALTRYEPLRRELYVSVFDLDEAHLPEVRRRIDRFGARFLHGYPSALEVLGRSYRAAGERPPGLNGVFAVSENLYPGQREYLEELLGAPVLSFYGMSEKAAFAGECASRKGYHVHESYGHIELVDVEGRVITQPGVRGEIVTTGLLSTSVPLIRYRTGDFSAWMEGECDCGRRGRRLASIEGRWDREYLVTGSGSRLFMTALNVHSAVFDHVERFRFVQDVAGIVRLLVVPGPSYERTDAEKIRAELAAKTSGQVELEIVEVGEIALTPRGKGIFIEQNVPESKGDRR